MKTDVWMPFYVGDYLADTMHLTTEQHGGYLLLLLHAWKNDGFIPGDESQLAAITKQTESSWKANANLLLSFWDSQTDGRYTQSRLLKEVGRAKQVSSARAAAGAKGGRPKAIAKLLVKQNETKPEANQKLNETPSQSQSPDHKTEEGQGQPLPEIPPMSRKDFDKLCEMRGIPKDCADWYWNDNDGRGWVTPSGQPITKVEPLLLNFFSKWRANAAKQQKPEPQKSKGGIADYL